MRIIKCFKGIVTGMLLAMSAAHAQAPSRTTETFESWTLVCERHENMQKPTCGIYSSQNVKNGIRTVRLSQISIGREQPGGALKIFFQIPANIWVQSGVQLNAKQTKLDVSAQVKWCRSERCLAEADLKQPAIERISGSPNSARIEFQDAAQKPVQILVSLLGFSDAFKEMEKNDSEP